MANVRGNVTLLYRDVVNYLCKYINLTIKIQCWYKCHAKNLKVINVTEDGRDTPDRPMVLLCVCLRIVVSFLKYNLIISQYHKYIKVSTIPQSIFHC